MGDAPISKADEKARREAYDREVREWMAAQRGPEHRYGCGPFFIGAGLAAAVYVIGIN